MIGPTVSRNISSAASHSATGPWLVKVAAALAALLLAGVYLMNAALDERLLVEAEHSARNVALLTKSKIGRAHV